MQPIKLKHFYLLELGPACSQSCEVIVSSLNRTLRRFSVTIDLDQGFHPTVHRVLRQGERVIDKTSSAVGKYRSHDAFLPLVLKIAVAEPQVAVTRQLEVQVRVVSHVEGVLDKLYPRVV